MTLLFNLDEEIENKEKEGFSDAAERMKEFKNISGVDRYIFGDGEDFLNPIDYSVLLRNIKKLLEDTVDLGDIKAEKSESGIVVKYSINSSCKEVLLPEDTDWIQPEIFNDLNKSLKELGCDKFIQLVFTRGIEYADQCIELCAIDNKVYENLKSHTNQYAE